MSRYIDADRLLSDRLMAMYYHLPNGDTAIPIIDIKNAPSIDIVRCKECIYYDPPHVDNHGERIEYEDLPKEAFGNDVFCLGFVSMEYGINIGGRCTVDYNCGYAEDKRVYRKEDDFCSKGARKDDENN